MRYVYMVLWIMVILSMFGLIISYVERKETTGVIRNYHDEQIGKGWVCVIAGFVLILLVFYMKN